jgi:hypothetical protein
MSKPFETNPLQSVYTGVMQNCNTFEVSPVGPDNPSTLIRTDQDWGVHLEWTMTGGLVLNLQEEFRVTVFLEDMSPNDADKQLGPVHVPTFAGALGPGPARTYKLDIPAAAGTVSAGVYEVTVLVQLYETAPSNSPWPVACFDELPIINIFKPGP